MTYCYQRTFDPDEELELENDETVVAGVPASKPNGVNRILVESDTQKSSETDTYYCSASLSDGSRCSREVDGPNERCWDHED